MYRHCYRVYYTVIYEYTAVVVNAQQEGIHVFLLLRCCIDKNRRIDGLAHARIMLHSTRRGVHPARRLVR